MKLSYSKKENSFILQIEEMNEFIEMQMSLRTYVTTINEWIASYEEMDDKKDYAKDKEKDLETLRAKKLLVQSLLNDFKETDFKQTV